MARQDRRQREFERRGQEILDAALALCATPELGSVTVEQIAERSDVGKGTVYKHFASKDELLFRLMLRFYRGLLAELRGLPVEGPPLVQLGDIIEHALRYHLAHLQYRYVVEYCERIDFKERAEPVWRDDFLELDRAFAEWSTPLVEAGMASGTLARWPVQDVLLGMSACFKGAVSLLWAGSDWCPLGDDRETVIRAVRHFMLAALTGAPAGDTAACGWAGIDAVQAAHRFFSLD